MKFYGIQGRGVNGWKTRGAKGQQIFNTEGSESTENISATLGVCVAELS